MQEKATKIMPPLIATNSFNPFKKKAVKLKIKKSHSFQNEKSTLEVAIVTEFGGLPLAPKNK